MLSEKLRSRTLFEDKPTEDTKQVMALKFLEECVDHLVILMKTIENMGIMEREDIEDYVIAYLEAYEKRYYAMEGDAFDAWLSETLRR